MPGIKPDKKKGTYLSVEKVEKIILEHIDKEYSNKIKEEEENIKRSKQELFDLALCYDTEEEVNNKCLEIRNTSEWLWWLKDRESKIVELHDTIRKAAEVIE